MEYYISFPKIWLEALRFFVIVSLGDCKNLDETNMLKKLNDLVEFKGFQQFLEIERMYNKNIKTQC